jgi:hypothetical protein
VSADSEFASRLKALIRRVESWSYADSDAGAGVPVEVADELRVLASTAPTTQLRRSLGRAQDALDDGLPAEAVAAELYRVEAEVSATPNQDSPPPFPPSWKPGRRSPNRGRSPKRGRSP